MFFNVIDIRLGVAAKTDPSFCCYLWVGGDRSGRDFIKDPEILAVGVMLVWAYIQINKSAFIFMCIEKKKKHISFYYHFSPYSCLFSFTSFSYFPPF